MAALTDDEDILVTVLLKDNEKYAFLCREDRLKELDRALGRLTANPALSFSSRDADKVRKMMQEATKP